jgi:DNA-binding CsgD family transcriptional regulator
MPGMNAESRLLELVGEAYAFESLDEFRPGVLELLLRAVPSLSASYNEVSPDGALVVSRPDEYEELLPTFIRLAHQNPILAAHRRTGDGRPHRISDFIDRDALHSLELYSELYSRFGIESQVAFTLPARTPLVLGIALNRDARDFSDDEVGLLGRARPHLIQAFRHAELATARAATIKALEAGLDDLDQHVAVLDRHGRVEFATQGARAMLEDDVPDWVAAARRGAAEPSRLLESGALVRLLPAGRNDGRDVLLIEGGTVELTVDALRGLGLTTREAQMLRLLALGTPAHAAASQLGIARRTADKHLQHVYAKLGVATAQEATRTAWAAVGIRRSTA